MRRYLEIIFEAENGLNTGYIAIDDVEFLDCDEQAEGHQCGYGEYTCKSGQCISQTKVKKKPNLVESFAVFLLKGGSVVCIFQDIPLLGTDWY